MKSEYDVVVIGGGPAGSITAKTIAEKGLEVLLIEKRQEIGNPIRCAEGVSRNIIESFIKLDKRWISSEVDGARIYAPDGIFFQLGRSDSKLGLVLERKIFDRELAQTAINAGADIYVKTSAIGLLKNRGIITGVKIRSFGEDFEIKSKIVVGADGIESKVGRWAGIDTTLKLEDTVTCAQFLMTNIDIDTKFLDFFLGNKIAPAGYAWIFPKGKNTANVGIGIMGSRAEITPIEYLNKFVKERFPDGKTIGLTIGAVPTSGPIERTVSNGLLLVGDAAHQSDPISGGGICNALICGKLAGNVIAEAISKKDYTTKTLNKYENGWRATLNIEKNYHFKELFIEITDGYLNNLVHSLNKLFSYMPNSEVTQM